MPKTYRVMFISNLSHSEKSLKELWKASEKNITEIYGAAILPLGILSIQSYVQNKCENVISTIIDLNTAFVKRIKSGIMEKELEYCANNFEDFLMDEMESELHQFCPDVVAISSLFDKSISTLLTLSSLVKKVLPNCMVIAGGHPANNLYEYILEKAHGTIDAVSYGEGEIPFKELLLAENLHEYIQTSSYFITKSKLGTDFEKKNAYIENLDDIPMYDYDSYFAKYGESVLELHNNVLDANHSFNRQAVIMTSRGCPYNCIFCASREVHGRKMRENSIERVKKEIDYWVEKKHIETLGFMDDHFLYDVERAIELCDYAGTKGLDIRFPNGLAIAPITEELVQCMVRNNVKEVQLALESGSERVLREIIKKPLSLEIADKVFGYFKNTNIFVKCFMVIGFPDETDEDIEAGLQYLRCAEFNWCSISNPTPISGSRLLKQGLEEGIITEYDLDNVSYFKSSYVDQKKYNGDLRYTVNLDINFVHNALMRMGKYEDAKKRFESILVNYPEHAFAWWFLSKCQKELELESINSKNKYFQIIKCNEKWKQYAMYFGLPTNEEEGNV